MVAIRSLTNQNLNSIYDYLTRYIDHLTKISGISASPEKINAINVLLHNIATDLARFNQVDAEHGINRPTFSNLANRDSKTQNFGLATLLHIVPHVTAKLVLTPHPTETLSEEARQIIMDLKNILFEAARDEMPLESQLLPFMQNIESKIRDLANCEFKPQEKMTAEDEVARSSKAAVDIINSLPLVVRDYLKAIDQEKISSIDRNTFYRLVKLLTWAGSDRDGKLNVTSDKLEKALQTYQEDARKFYTETIASDIVVEILKAITPSKDDVNHKTQIKAELDILRESIKKEPTTDRAVALLSTFKQNISGLISENSLKLIELAEHITNIASQQLATSPIDHRNFLKSLEQIADESKSYAPKGKSGLTLIDELCIKTANMGAQTNAIQVRENRTQIYNAWDVIFKKFGAEFNLQPEYKDNLTTSASANLRRLLEHLQHHPEWIDGLDKTSQESPYHTMRNFQLAAQNPDAIESYVIAECEGHIDVNLAEFLATSMNAGNLEVIPLFEGLQAIETTRETTGEVTSYENIIDWFHEFKDANGREDPDLVTIDRKTLEPRKMTVRDVLHFYGIAESYFIKTYQFPREDLDKPLTKRRTFMFAGSDSIKNCGMAVIPLIERAKEHAIMQGLVNGTYVQIYGGEGTAVARKKGGYDEEQTFQGREMRDGTEPHKVAAQIESMITWNSNRRTSGDNLTARGTLHTSEISTNNPNLYPREDEEQWKKIDKRCNYAVNAYRQHYERPDELKTQTESLSADFVAFYKNGVPSELLKKANYSARAAKKEIPDDPRLPHQKTRAIGYNQEMCISGSCAHMYLGMMGFFVKYEDNNYKAQDITSFNKLISKLTFEDNLNELANVCAASPKVHEMLLRTAYGLVMADFVSAWKYLGGEYNEKTGEVKLAGKPTTLLDIATNSDNPAAKELARINIEHAALCPVLTAIFKDIEAGQPKYSNTLALQNMCAETDQKTFDNFLASGQAQQNLLDALPGGMRVELQEKKKMADNTRRVIVDHRNDPELSSDVHAMISSMVEIFESTPAYMLDSSFKYVETSHVTQASSKAAATNAR